MVIDLAHSEQRVPDCGSVLSWRRIGGGRSNEATVAYDADLLCSQYGGGVYVDLLLDFATEGRLCTFGSVIDVFCCWGPSIHLAGKRCCWTRLSTPVPRVL